MDRTLTSGLSSPGSSPGQGPRLHYGLVQDILLTNVSQWIQSNLINGYHKFNAGGSPVRNKYPIQGYM